MAALDFQTTTIVPSRQKGHTVVVQIGFHEGEERIRRMGEFFSRGLLNDKKHGVGVVFTITVTRRKSDHKFHVIRALSKPSAKYELKKIQKEFASAYKK